MGRARHAVTTAEIEATAPLELDCGTCTLCIEACPTGALDEPGVVDATKCLSYWTQAPASIPDGYRAELDAQVYGCDICQDVCPWNRGVERRRAGLEVPAEATPHVRLADWLGGDGEELRNDSSGSTCRRTIRAICSGMRSWRSATPVPGRRKAHRPVRW